jgi:putative ABC transport system substrate-binding protein
MPERPNAILIVGPFTFSPDRDTLCTMQDEGRRMRRREFIAGLGSTAAWPVVARAQQAAIPIVGLLETGSPGPDSLLLAAFRNGPSENGYVEGRNLTVEYRSAEGQIDRLPALAAELVRLQVAVIITPGSSPATRAAKAATSKIPIVFSVGADPVQMGLVDSLNRPGGNLTGLSEMNAAIGPKRFELLRQIVPKAARFGVLVNPKNLLTEFAVREAQAAAAKIGRQIEVLAASTDRDIDVVFDNLMQKQVDALVVTPEPLFYVRREQITTLAVRHAIPAIYWDPAFPEAGGLMSYGSSVPDSYRQVGIYVGRVLKGAKPADLPVQQSTKFQLVISARAAKALGLTIPETLLATADEVIQ